MTFLEYARNWGHGLDRDLYAPYGQLTTWEEHRSANALLDALRPDRIAMLAITSRNQIALRMAARKRSIDVRHVEHGYRLPVRVREDAALGEPRRSGPRGGVRTNAFFLNSVISAGPSIGPAMLTAGARATAAGSGVAHPKLARARVPDGYVSFSEECFAYHRLADRVPNEIAARTHYTGVPQFDCFDEARNHRPQERLAVMADHQLHNVGIRGWSREFRSLWIRRLAGTLADAGWRLVLKRHPGDRENAWSEQDDATVRLVDGLEELANEAQRAALVLGTGSTLQLPLVASPHAAAITLEIHPESGPDLSGRLVEEQVAISVDDFQELRVNLDRTEELRQCQAPHKEAFVRRFLYRLDGKAGERMATALGTVR